MAHTATRASTAPARGIDLHGQEGTALESIRYALVIGLQCYAEIERLGGAEPNPPTPIHPTGSDETIARLADALHWVEVMCKSMAKGA